MKQFWPSIDTDLLKPTLKLAANIKFARVDQYEGRPIKDMYDMIYRERDKYWILRSGLPGANEPRRSLSDMAFRFG